MLFKGKKAAKEQERNDAWTQQEKQFDAEIKKVDQIEDPAKRLIKLKIIQNQISIEIFNEQIAISNTVFKKEKRSFAVGAGAGWVGGMAALSLLTGPLALVAIPVIAGGVVGGTVVADKRGKSAQKKLETASAKHVEYLGGQVDRISEIMDTVIENNMKEISQSPRYADALSVPSIAQKFAAVAAKRLAAEDEKPVVDPAQGIKEAPPVVEAPKTTAPKQKPDYNKIKKAGF